MSASPQAIMARAAELGFQLRAAGGKVVIRHPSQKPPADLVEDIRACKPDILNLLRHQPGKGNVPAPETNLAFADSPDSIEGEQRELLYNYVFRQGLVVARWAVDRSGDYKAPRPHWTIQERSTTASLDLCLWQAGCFPPHQDRAEKVRSIVGQLHWTEADFKDTY